MEHLEKKSKINLNKKRITKLIERFYEIESQTAEEADTIVYLPKSLIQTTFPHSKVEGNTFERQNGEFTLTMIGYPNWKLGTTIWNLSSIIYGMARWTNKEKK